MKKINVPRKPNNEVLTLFTREYDSTKNEVTSNIKKSDSLKQKYRQSSLFVVSVFVVLIIHERINDG
jgi:hypothetical protein